MTIQEALGSTGALLLIPMFVCWILFGVSYWSNRVRGVWYWGFKWWTLVLSILFTIAVLLFWLAAIWQGVR